VGVKDVATATDFGTRLSLSRFPRLTSSVKFCMPCHCINIHHELVGHTQFIDEYLIEGQKGVLHRVLDRATSRGLTPYYHDLDVLVLGYKLFRHSHQGHCFGH